MILGLPWLFPGGGAESILSILAFFVGRNEAFSVVRCVCLSKIRVWRLGGVTWSSLALSIASWRH